MHFNYSWSSFGKERTWEAFKDCQGKFRQRDPKTKRFGTALSFPKAEKAITLYEKKHEINATHGHVHFNFGISLNYDKACTAYVELKAGAFNETFSLLNKKIETLLQDASENTLFSQIGEQLKKYTGYSLHNIILEGPEFYLSVAAAKDPHFLSGVQGYAQIFAIALDIRSNTEKIVVTWRAAGGLSGEYGHTVARNGVKGSRYGQSKFFGIWEIDWVPPECDYQKVVQDFFSPEESTKTLTADLSKPNTLTFNLSTKPKFIETEVNPPFRLLSNDDNARERKWGVRGEFHYSRDQLSGEVFISNPALIGLSLAVLGITALYKYWYRSAIEKLNDFSRKNYAAACQQIETNCMGVFSLCDDGELRRTFISEAEKFPIGSSQRYLFRAIAYILRHNGISPIFIKEWHEQQYTQTIATFTKDWQILFDDFMQIAETLNSSEQKQSSNHRHIIARLNNMLYGKGMDIDGTPLGAMAIDPDNPACWLMSMQLELLLNKTSEASATLKKLKILANDLAQYAFTNYEQYRQEVVSTFTGRPRNEQQNQKLAFLEEEKERQQNFTRLITDSANSLFLNHQINHALSLRKTPSTFKEFVVKNPHLPLNVQIDLLMTAEFYQDALNLYDKVKPEEKEDKEQKIIYVFLLFMLGKNSAHLEDKIDYYKRALKAHESIPLKQDISQIVIRARLLIACIDTEKSETERTSYTKKVKQTLNLAGIEHNAQSIHEQYAQILFYFSQTLPSVDEQQTLYEEALNMHRKVNVDHDLDKIEMRVNLLLMVGSKNSEQQQQLYSEAMQLFQKISLFEVRQRIVYFCAQVINNVEDEACFYQKLFQLHQSANLAIPLERKTRILLSLLYAQGVQTSVEKQTIVQNAIKLIDIRTKDPSECELSIQLLSTLNNDEDQGEIQQLQKTLIELKQAEYSDSKAYKSSSPSV